MTRNYRESLATRFADAARVHFELFHPTAKRVFIAGSFNGWNPSATAMASAGHGKWLRELWLPPGEHEYLLVVNGDWMFDPRADDHVPNVFGGMNAVVQARSPAKSVPRGVVAMPPSFATRGTKKGQPSPRLVECCA